MIMQHTKTTINGYTYSDVYYDQGTINVPFSWEYKPGFSKVTHHNGIKHATKLVLQPPPCSLSGVGSRSDRFKVEDTQIPLGLCAVQPLHRISSFRMEISHHQKEEDPFVEAYKKCTKSPFINLQRPASKGTQKTNNGSWPSIRKYMHILSCKYSGDVVISRKAVYTSKM